MLGKTAEEVGRSLATHTLRLAITGLSRSGKTVFTTALVHALTRSPEHPNLLPFLDIVGGGRLVDVTIEPLEGFDFFPYAEELKKLTAWPPRWPEKTTEMSGLRAKLRYRPKSAMLAKTVGLATLNLEIIDYPGEWLLDLSMLGKTFDAWSRETLALCNSGARARLSESWLRQLALVESDGAGVDFSKAEATAQRLGEAYRAFLKACAAPIPDLKLLQPGRFVCGYVPEDLLFCPLPPESSGAGRGWRGWTTPKTERQALYRVMERRFERYKAEMIEPFYRKHFARFDRQIVLVDVLTALNAGHETFYDVRRAMTGLVENYQFGSGLLGKLASKLGLAKIKIDRVLFAATKADHITPAFYGGLRQLLEQMATEKIGQIRSDGAAVGFEVIASIKSTRNVTCDYLGKPLQVLQGSLTESPDIEDIFNPGIIPAYLPGPEDWDNGYITFFEFAPPRLMDADTLGIPHINVDKALQFLIGS